MGLAAIIVSLGDSDCFTSPGTADLRTLVSRTSRTPELRGTQADGQSRHRARVPGPHRPIRPVLEMAWCTAGQRLSAGRVPGPPVAGPPARLQPAGRPARAGPATGEDLRPAGLRAAGSRPLGAASAAA